jgi:hypothetical protein
LSKRLVHRKKDTVEKHRTFDLSRTASSADCTSKISDSQAKIRSQRMSMPREGKESIFGKG